MVNNMKIKLKLLLIRFTAWVCGGTSSTTHAEYELQKLDSSFIVKEFEPALIIATYMFMKSGQSGGSASYAAQALSKALKKLCLFEPLTPIEDVESEWGEPLMKGSRQHRRLSSVFKEAGGVCTYLYGIVFVNQRGFKFTSSNIEGVLSQVDIKFPFVPKTFYVNVIEEGESIKIVDYKQVGEAYKYFDTPYTYNNQGG